MVTNALVIALSNCCVVAAEGAVAAPSPRGGLGVADPATLKSRIEAGLSQNLAYMKSRNETLYPRWPRVTANQFVIFDDKKLFYNGLFYANLAMIADVAGVKFELGAKPQLVAILAENLKTWADVNTFLATQSTTFRIPDQAMQSPFTGCNKFQYSDNGTVRLAVLVIDITEARDFHQIDRCVFSELISAFGFDTTALSSNVVSELTLLRIIYGLNDKDRGTDRIVDEILRRVPTDK